MPLPTVISPGDPGHITHHETMHAMLNAIVSPFSIAQDASGTLGARPAAGTAGRYYLATDEGTLYRDSGSGWVPVHNMLTTWAASLLSTGNNLASFKWPAALTTKGVAQTCNSGSSIVVTFEAESFDNDGMHSISSNTNRITALRAGIYLAASYVAFDIGPFSAGLSMRVGGASTEFANSRVNTDGITPAVTAVGIVSLAVNDYIECVATQKSSPAAAADVNSGKFSAVMLSSV